jgi:PPOX class probable FMN-dependent enzyme
MTIVDPSPFTSPDELSECYRPPGEVVKRKIMDRIDEHAAAFIALSPFCCIGTADGEGRQDVSPRGDVPGFVRVLDEHHLFLPDRPGNNRLDSIRNLLANPRIGMLFLIPGFLDALRVNGTATVGRPTGLLEESTVDGKVPKSGLVIEAEEVFVHCGRAVKRGRLWDPTAQRDRSELPRLGEVLRDQLQPVAVEVGEAMERLDDESYLTKLY